ncbi:MAG: ATP synthase F1 subunit gamma [Lachnospiraceae bacterium]|mgnify:CR=1 FL=1|jgi:F-type H+-transporting ATPase subunit gamma|nr:ATP synthase F1 subunit gamma [Lachnospiraceae bacterium]MCI9598918.1 ATP synthase F1 subunit gamma [Lachnospiraceae bacterium]MDE6895267.1 ATP synthase F1 subunit gamma [Lachnospiraceae bacterium]
MAGLREIKSRIKSIEDTRTITSAMYMISSTKMKKAKQTLEATEPYFYTLQSTIDRILRHIPDMEHIYFEKPEIKRTKIGLLVITDDKGLAGSYNHNILKMAQRFLDDAENQVDLFVVGELGRQYFVSKGVHIEENFQYTVQNPTFNRARWISETILDKYRTGEISEVHVIYTRMESSMQSVAEDKMLLPIRRPLEETVPADVYQEDFLLLPSAKEAIDTIIPNYITGFIYGALVQAYCTAHNARMMAMESATNNADDLLRDLKIMYNRARQAEITQEITEVCSGAKAQQMSRNGK